MREITVDIEKPREILQSIHSFKIDSFINKHRRRLCVCVCVGLGGVFVSFWFSFCEYFPYPVALEAMVFKIL